MEIKKVENKKDLSAFVKLPWKLYKNDKNWVPPLVGEFKALLDEKKNPFWEHSAKKLFIACDESNNCVGRVAAIVDRNFLEFHGEQTGFFGFFECIDDLSVAKELLSAAEMWLKEKGITKIIGPTAPSTNDEMGLLAQGYNSPPYLMMPYNPPYYHELVIAAGFTKAKDLLAYIMEEKDAPKERLGKIVKLVEKKEPFLKVRTINPKNYNSEISKIHQIYNNAWEKNWGFVPWTQKEFFAQCAKLKSLILADFILIAEIKDLPVGVLVGVPNYNEVLIKLNGRLGPVEILKFLYLKNKIKTARVMIMGVVKEHRNKGIEALMYSEIIKNGPKHGMLTAEFSWVLEDNTLMCRAAEMLGGKQYKKYTVYEKNI